MKPREFFEQVVLPYRGEDCLIWPFATDRKGYARLSVNNENCRVHRLACIAVHGAPPSSSHQAAHSCGKGSSACVAPSHLSWKTPLENSADTKLHGTSNAGERHRSVKLTEAEVFEIRGRPMTESRVRIAKEFGVNPSTVSQVIHRKTWTHI